MDLASSLFLSIRKKGKSLFLIFANLSRSRTPHFGLDEIITKKGKSGRKMDLASSLFLPIRKEGKSLSLIFANLLRSKIPHFGLEIITKKGKFIRRIASFLFLSIFLQNFTFSIRYRDEIITKKGKSVRKIDFIQFRIE